jgi:hypothetical protein
VATELPSRNDGVTIRACQVCGAGFQARGRRQQCSDRARSSVVISTLERLSPSWVSHERWSSLPLTTSRVPLANEP